MICCIDIFDGAMLHSAMRSLPVTPHENTELLVNPGPTRIQIGHMTQYDIIKYSIVHVYIAQLLKCLSSDSLH